MKKLFVLLAAILLFCCACGNVPDDARGRLFMYTRADEDEYGVYWVSRGYSSDEPEPFCTKGLYYYNKATGETYHYSDNFDFLALYDGILYFCTSKLQGDREIFIIPAETFRAAPEDWRKKRETRHQSHVQLYARHLGRSILLSVRRIPRRGHVDRRESRKSRVFHRNQPRRLRL